MLASPPHNFVLLTSCLPAGCRVAPVVTPPPPLVLSSRRCRLLSSRRAAYASRQRHASRRATTSCTLAPLLPFTSRSPASCHVTSRHAAASRSRVHSRPPPSCALAGSPVASRRAAHVAPATHLPFASHSPQLVACVFDLVCLISRFLAVRACIFQQLEGHKCRFRQLCYSV